MTVSPVADELESQLGGLALEATPLQRYELCFHALEDQHCAYAFPCDALGRVDMDALSDQARLDYLYARAMIGLVLARPSIRSNG